MHRTNTGPSIEPYRPLHRAFGIALRRTGITMFVGLAIVQYYYEILRALL